jgi:preprotein translocase subunit SecF
VQQFGDSADEFLIRTPEAGGSTAQFSQKVKQALEAKYGAGKLEILRLWR